MLNVLKDKMTKASAGSPRANASSSSSSKQFFENMIKEKEKQGEEEGGSGVKRSSVSGPKKFSMAGLAKNLNENEESLENEQET